MPVIVPRVIVKDWDEGHDPGMTLGRLVGADGSLLTAASSWSLKVFDLSTGPTIDITPGQPGTFSGVVFTTNPLLSSSLTAVLDGFWTEDSIGYNFRHYVKASDFNSPALKGGHSYRFEYVVVTPDFDGIGLLTNKWGPFVIKREGTCREMFR